METVKILRRIFLIGAIVASVTMIVSGSFVLISKNTKKGEELYNQIVVSSFDQSNDFTISQDYLLPGESKTCKVVVTSMLVERVKYSFGFFNHEIKASDKYLYVSVNSPGDEPYINNTLDQIFDGGYGIYNKILDSMQSKTYYFTFSVLETLTEAAEFDFDICFYAEGKITN